MIDRALAEKPVGQKHARCSIKVPEHSAKYLTTLSCPLLVDGGFLIEIGNSADWSDDFRYIVVAVGKGQSRREAEWWRVNPGYIS